MNKRKNLKEIIKNAALILAAFSLLSAQNKIEFGIDVLLSERMELIENKRLGIVTNKSAVFANGESLIDSLLKISSGEVKSYFDIRSLYGLEHGIDLESAHGELVEDSNIDQIKVYSLYGENKKPTARMLSNIEIILFDVQDIGTRFYTYISSLYYIIEACGENGVKMVVLDRPNPISGTYVDGPILEDEFKSFVGIDNLPVTHGMTIGELALYFNDRISSSAEIEIIKMKGWKRDSYWDDYDVDWVNPSPNIVDFETALLYPATVFFEGTNISEGRGTYMPFSIFGAPFIDSVKLKKEIEKLELPYLETRSIEFVPFPIAGKASDPKYNGDICKGIQLKILKRENYRPVELAVHLLHILNKLYPNDFEIKDYFDLLWGTDAVRKQLKEGKKPDDIISSWQPGLERFKAVRKNYLLY